MTHALSLPATWVGDNSVVETATGRYRLVREVSAPSGHGVVWLGEDTQTREPVAVKFARQGVPGLLEVLVREGLILSALQERVAEKDKSRFPQFFGQGSVTGHGLFIVLEWIPGVMAIQRAHRLREMFQDPVERRREQLRLFEGMLEALAALHRAGFLHRDLNLTQFMAPDDRSAVVRLLDFGTAGKVDGDSRGFVIGRSATELLYTAPEVIANPSAHSVQSEIYSMALLFYAMLKGEQELSKLVAWREAAQWDIAWDPFIPSQIKPFLLRALNVRPATRYQTVDDFLAAVREVRAAWPKGGVPLDAQTLLREAT